MKPTLLEINGETRSIREWSRHAHRPLATILLRLKQGWAPEDAVFEGRRNLSTLLKIGRKSKTLKEWTAEPGAMSYQTIHWRLKQGWSAKRAVFEPSARHAVSLPTLPPEKRREFSGMRGRVDPASLPAPILPRWGSSRTWPLEALDVLRRV